MGIEERFVWLIVGCFIGFVLGYYTRYLRSIKEETHEMKEIVVNEFKQRRRDERGAISPKFRNSVALGIVVALTAFASVQSQIASNKVTSTQEDLKAATTKLDRIVDCVIETNTELLDAINTRTTYTQGQAISNADLQRAQAVFFGILLHRPPYSQMRREEAARIYQDALDKFITAATASENNAKFTKYPKAEDLEMCIKTENDKE